MRGGLTGIIYDQGIPMLHLILYLVFNLFFVFKSHTAAAEKMGAVRWESMSSLSSRAGLEKGQKSPRKPFHAVAWSCLGSRVSLSFGFRGGGWIDWKDAVTNCGV